MYLFPPPWSRQTVWPGHAAAVHSSFAHLSLPPWAMQWSEPCFAPWSHPGFAHSRGLPTQRAGCGEGHWACGRRAWRSRRGGGVAEGGEDAVGAGAVRISAAGGATAMASSAAAATRGCSMSSSAASSMTSTPSCWAPPSSVMPGHLPHTRSSISTRHPQSSRRPGAAGCFCVSSFLGVECLFLGAWSALPPRPTSCRRGDLRRMGAAGRSVQCLR
mmetsp:Transcript_33676/g.108774  ORF Transcript_33676/g.108774 Transcript_33676/m.108774 type:complete len:216 (+) Transcript_33676:148-795(+)